MSKYIESQPLFQKILKSESLIIRLTPQEKELIREQAFKKELSLTEYILGLVIQDINKE